MNQKKKQNLVKFLLLTSLLVNVIIVGWFFKFRKETKSHLETNQLKLILEQAKQEINKDIKESNLPTIEKLVNDLNSFSEDKENSAKRKEWEKSPKAEEFLNELKIRENSLKKKDLSKSNDSLENKSESSQGNDSSLNSSLNDNAPYHSQSRDNIKKLKIRKYSPNYYGVKTEDSGGRKKDLECEATVTYGSSSYTVISAKDIHNVIKNYKDYWKEKFLLWESELKENNWLVKEVRTINNNQKDYRTYYEEDNSPWSEENYEKNLKEIKEGLAKIESEKIKKLANIEEKITKREEEIAKKGISKNQAETWKKEAEDWQGQKEQIRITAKNKNAGSGDLLSGISIKGKISEGDIFTHINKHFLNMQAFFEEMKNMPEQTCCQCGYKFLPKEEGTLSKSRVMWTKLNGEKIEEKKQKVHCGKCSKQIWNDKTKN